LILAAEAERIGDWEEVRALCEESLRLAPTVAVEAHVLNLLATVAFEEGRGDYALDLLRDSARLATQASYRWCKSFSLVTFGEYAIRLGRPLEARESTREGLAIARTIGDRQQVFYGVTVVAWLAAEDGRLEEAGRLWGVLRPRPSVRRSASGRWSGTTTRRTS
jgi:hypothetical protein